MARSSERITLRHTRTAVIEREQKECAIRIRVGTVKRNPVNCTVMFFFLSHNSRFPAKDTMENSLNIPGKYKDSFFIILMLLLIPLPSLHYNEIANFP